MNENHVIVPTATSNSKEGNAFIEVCTSAASATYTPWAVQISKSSNSVYTCSYQSWPCYISVIPLGTITTSFPWVCRFVCDFVVDYYEQYKDHLFPPPHRTYSVRVFPNINVPLIRVLNAHVENPHRSNRHPRRTGKDKGG